MGVGRFQQTLVESVPAARRAGLDDLVKCLALGFAVNNRLARAEVVAEHLGDEQPAAVGFIAQSLRDNETHGWREPLPDLFLLGAVEETEHSIDRLSAVTSVRR